MTHPIRQVALGRSHPGYHAAVREAVRLNEAGYGAAVWIQIVDDLAPVLFVGPTHPNREDLPWGRPFSSWTLFELPRP